jgi:hypothetical protein
MIPDFGRLQTAGYMHVFLKLDIRYRLNPEQIKAYESGRAMAEQEIMFRGAGSAATA